MFLSSEAFFEFLQKIENGLGGFREVIAPIEIGIGGKTAYKKLTPENSIGIKTDSFRTVNPLKYYIYPPRENVYPVESDFPKRLIAGVKACDLASLEILDAALLNSGFTEPAYVKRRENTYIISCDCDEAGEFCHCVLCGGKPFAEKGFDLNLSKSDDGYIVEIGSGKGKELIELIKSVTEIKTEESKHLSEVTKKREQIYQSLKSKNGKFIREKEFDEIRQVNGKWWDQKSEECIGCGACTNVCPSCYCLILNDESEKNEFKKVRTYDSCQWHGYARVAGGGSPRPKMNERFRNRYLCKFDYMTSNFGRSGCTGCGRCTEACAAGIDFRDVASSVTDMAEQSAI